jgi:hypothetical protein
MIATLPTWIVNILCRGGFQYREFFASEQGAKNAARLAKHLEFVVDVEIVPPRQADGQRAEVWAMLYGFAWAFGGSKSTAGGDFAYRPNGQTWAKVDRLFVPSVGIVAGRSCFFCEMDRNWQMKRAAFPLIVLLTLAPFDEAWGTFPVLSFPSAPDDNDEYLPQEREQSEERSEARQPVLFVRLKEDYTGHFTINLRSMSGDVIFARKLNPPSLYVFMSLRCWESWPAKARRNRRLRAPFSARFSDSIQEQQSPVNQIPAARSVHNAGPKATDAKWNVGAARRLDAKKVTPI